MIDDASLAALQRSINEHREAKRKIKIRLAEIEAEAESLRSQISMHDTMIEHSEMMLRRMLLPADSPPSFLTQSQLDRLAAQPRYDEPSLRNSAEIEAEVAKLRQNEKSSNVRFNDFRIPQAATIVLREAQGPLHVSEIYRRMSEGGFEFRGQHQLITLAVSLSRSKRFRKVAPGTFELDPKQESPQSNQDEGGDESFPQPNVSNSSS
ncbi:MAG: hypothetical protein ACREEM_07475 [Blastocatellia bacterium]